MKKLSSLLLLIGLFSGCSLTTNTVEETPKEIINKLLINEVEEEIKFAEMITYQKLPANTNYKFNLIFHTGTTEAVYVPTRSYTGIGSYFSFTLWSNDSTIASGVYTVDGYVNKTFSISEALAILHVDWSTGERDFGSYLNGTVTIKNESNGIYQIDINCIDYNGNPVTAYYEGAFYTLEE